MREQCEAKPCLPTPWRLRNDGSNLVAYRCVPGELTHRVLSDLEATIIPFCDGTRDLRQLRQIWFTVHDISEEMRSTWSGYFKDLINKHLSSDGLLAVGETASPSLAKSVDHFIPDFPNYAWPSTRLERPIDVAIVFTNRCECDCQYCYAERIRGPETELTRWCDFFDELARNEIFMVDIGGGDFLTRKDWREILREMVERDFVFFLSTKCSVSPSDARYIAHLGVGGSDVPPHLRRPFQLSVDSPDAETASFLTGRRNYLEDAVLSARNSVEAGLRPRIKCVLTSYNADAVPGLVQLFAEIGVCDFQFVQYGRSFFCHDDRLFLSPDQKASLLDIAAVLERDHPACNIEFQTSTADDVRWTWERWHARSVCSGGRLNLWVKPNGDVTLCEQVPHEDQFVVGNVFKQDIETIWHSERLLGFLYPTRAMFDGTVCYDCPEYDECHMKQGYCYRDTLFRYGSIYDAPPQCPRQTVVGLRQN